MERGTGICPNCALYVAMNVVVMSTRVQILPKRYTVTLLTFYSIISNFDEVMPY